MATTRTCQQCGAMLPGHAAAWLCPKCLLGQAATPLPSETPLNPQPSTLNESTVLHYFGDYELLHEIARGGMGVVYKARQVSLNRIVAVKMLLFGKLAGDDFIKRFRAEAEAAASLQHPNIVAIHEVGEHEGQQYFSLDYVEGVDLATLVRDKPLSAKCAAVYVKIIAEAIHYAHGKGILHRDLKPSNVLIDASDRPRVTDFGLAKRLTSEAQSSALSSQLTITGQVLGTPGFMSPEQAGGKRGGVGLASDVYSLGALLYFLVTARAPFAADSLEETLRQVHQAEPISPRLLNPTVPRDVETICLKCLSKEPRRRYSSAGDLADELGRFLSDEPIRARPVVMVEKLWRWSRRKPGLAGALGACLILLLSLGIGSPIALYRIERSRQEAKAEATRAHQAERQAIANLHQSYLAQAQALRTSAKLGRQVQALEAISNAAKLETSMELRNEAIANLSQVDLRIASTHAVPRHQNNEILDRDFELAAVHVTGQQAEVRRAWDRQPVAQIRLPRGQIHLLRGFSADGRYLCLAGSDEGTCIWDFVQGTFILSKLPRDVAGDFSPDGVTFAIGNHSGSISLIDLSTGRERNQLGRGLPNQGVAYDPSGKKLACWDHGSLEVLNISDGERTRLEVPRTRYDYITRSIASANRVAWSADGQLLCACFGQQIYLWRVDDGQLIQALPGHGGPIISVAVSPSGEFIATSSFDETTRIWDFLTGRLLAMMPEIIWTPKFSRDGRYLGPARLLTNNCILELVRPPCFRRLSPPVPMMESQQAFDMSFSADGRLAAFGAWDGVRLWDCLTGQFLAALPTGSTRSALFDPDGSALWVSGDGELSRWPLRYQEEHGTNTLFIGPSQNIAPPGGSWSTAVIEPRSGKLAITSEARRAAITNLRAPTNWTRLEKIHERSHQIDISSDGRFVATGAWNGSGVNIWDAETGKLLHEHKNRPKARVAFSPDGRWLVSGGDQFEVVPVGQWTNWQALTPAGLGGMAFSPDGRLLARMTTTTSCELVDPDTWRSLAVLQSPYPFNLSAPRFSPDSTLLGAADSTLGLQIWDLRRLRAELRTMGLDWNHPPYPAATTPPEIKPIVAQVLSK